MRFRHLISILLPLLILLVTFSCKKKTEDYISEPLSDYMPLQVGKYIIYRMDSTVFTNLSTTIEIHKYQVKHEVDAAITDNLGRPSYRVITYIRDSAGTNAWVPNGSYFITPLANQVEVIENNLRYIKMHAPIKPDFNWKGNKYFPDDSYDALCHFNSFDAVWQESDYFYDGDVATSETIEGQTYNNVLTVQEEDITDNTPIYASRIYGVEKYAKEIGLVYRENILWEYQPPGSLPVGTYCGFGIKIWMIDHN
ncbi:MAG: hypothetical protein GC171_00405 [Terrimonas sp.]|nr:hypothetical protein [Terrimonas sp.]